MQEVSYVSEALQESLDDIEPVAFRQRLHSVIEGVSLTPAVLTVKTARAIEPSIDVESSAKRGAGVQLSYEGLRLTRSMIREKHWEAGNDRDSYYFDLLAAAVLVSRGYYYLADTGVATQSVEIVRRFGRNQTYEQQTDVQDLENSLEIDVIKLSVNAGADLAMQTIPPSIMSYGESLARDIQDEPLPGPDDALTGVDERIATLASTPEMTEVDEYDE